MKNFLYTDLNLVDVLPVDVKSFQDCGISTTNIIQITCENKVHSLIEIVDEDLFNSLLKKEVSYLDETQASSKTEELKAKAKKEIEEEIKKSLEYKVELLEQTVNSLKQENADLAFQMLTKEAK